MVARIRLALSIALLIAGPAAAQDDCRDLAGLAWLAGAWGSSEEGHQTTEVWLPPAGGLMLGMNRSVSVSGRAFFEFFRIAADESGAITYFASPLGREPISFRLVECGPGRAVFENSDHDYPQRVIYERRGEEMVAAIEGVEAGERKRSEWRLTRSALP